MTLAFASQDDNISSLSLPGITVDSVLGKVDETDLKEPTYTVKTSLSFGPRNHINDNKRIVY
jgi:hypothetical protein